MGQSFLCPVTKSTCPMLSTTTSQLFPPHEYGEICGHQDPAPGLEPDDNHSVMNSPDIITISIYFLVTKLHIL